MFALALAALAFAAGFLGLAYLIARAIAGWITARNDAREEKRARDNFWAARSRSHWRAF